MARPRYSNRNPERFLEDIVINRNALESCEVEVCAKAMSTYILFYPFYNNWMFSYDIESKRCKLVKNNYYVDADIITSKKSLEKKDVRTEILDAFKEVYYSLGNMMPVMGNCKAGEKDNWLFKMKYICEIFQSPIINKEILMKYQEGKLSFRYTSQYELWPGWISDCWNNNKEKFIDDNFLYDIFSDKIYDYDYYYAGKDEQFLIDTIKIIIQRSYRILQNKKGKFTDRDQEIIIDIFGFLSKRYGISLGETLFSLKNY